MEIVIEEVVKVSLSAAQQTTFGKIISEHVVSLHSMLKGRGVAQTKVFISLVFHCVK